jgi:hypothetical protein
LAAAAVRFSVRTARLAESFGSAAVATLLAQRLNRAVGGLLAMRGLLGASLASGDQFHQGGNSHKSNGAQALAPCTLAQLGT